MNTRSSLWAAFAILALGGLYIAFRQLQPESTPSDPASRVYQLVVSEPRTDGEFPVFKADQGDTVTVLIASDRPGEVNVHGYEKAIALQPGGEVSLTFIAQQPGQFPIHMHESLQGHDASLGVSHRHLASIEVQAK